MSDIATLKSSLTGTLSQIDKLLKFGFIFCLTVIAIRVAGRGSASIFGVNIDTKWTVSVLLLMTAAHLLLLHYFLADLSQAWRKLSVDQRVGIYEELFSQTLFTRGLGDIALRHSQGWLYFNPTFGHPTGVYYTLLYSCCVLASTEFTLDWMLPISFAFGISIASFNVNITSNWIVSIIDAKNPSSSLYFDDAFTPIPRYFSAYSMPGFRPPSRIGEFVGFGISGFIFRAIFVFFVYFILLVLANFGSA